MITGFRATVLGIAVATIGAGVYLSGASAKTLPQQPDLPRGQSQGVYDKDPRKAAAANAAALIAATTLAATMSDRARVRSTSSIRSGSYRSYSSGGRVK